MVNSNYIKSLILGLGANLCGIASVNRFKGAPKGFHPNDIYPDCKSVVVYAKSIPTSSINARSCVPYTFVNTMSIKKMDELTMKIVVELESLDIGCVPIPSDDPYEYWEPENSYGRAILSLRHAGHLSGLGVLGKNTLLINDIFGNIIQLGAVLINTELEQDPLASYEVCPSSCRICLDSCPKGALNGITVNQKLCRTLSTYKNKKGYTLMKCNLCRVKCPNALGLNEN